MGDPITVISKPTIGASGRTGFWRTFKPVINYEKCTNCLICWLYCPENSIEVSQGTVVINYDYCKGCGVCVNECPFKAVDFVLEGEQNA